jgi:hypothetical protein
MKKDWLKLPHSVKENRRKAKDFERDFLDLSYGCAFLIYYDCAFTGERQALSPKSPGTRVTRYKFPKCLGLRPDKGKRGRQQWLRVDEHRGLSRFTTQRIFHQD